MKKNYHLRAFFLGIVTALLVSNLAIPALAAAGKMIEVATGVRIFIDDVELLPTDSNGKPVDVFVYNGTTYLPVRALSEAFGKNIQWDGKTRSVYIGQHASDSPAAYLGQLDYFNSSNSWIADCIKKDNLGKEHTHSLDWVGSYHGFITYKLNAQYSRLTASYFQEYDARSYRQGETYTLIISGDGKQLWTGTVGPGIDPVNVDIDISGVSELKIEYPTGSECYTTHTSLGDVALWS